MSKKLRLLLVPLLLVAPSLFIRAQETEKVEEAVVQEVPDTTQKKEPADAEKPSPEAEKEAVVKEEAETTVEEPAVDESKEEPATEEQPADTEEKPAQEEQASEEAAPAEERSAEAPQWEQETPSEQVKQEQDTPPVASKKYGEDEVMGIDTVDLANPQGNWLYKRVWWERAEAKYERIRETVNKIMEVRTSFFSKRAELDKNVLDPFYIKIGISQGELQEILGELLVKVEKFLEGSQSNQIQEKAEEDKKSLQDIQIQVQKVVSQGDEVEKAILMLVEQITKVRNIESQAWQDFKGIARVLDDKKARELFYKVDAAWRNIKGLQQYIEQTFTGRFDQLVTKVKEQVQRVDQEMNAIKESGIDLKQRLLGAQRTQMEMEEEEQEEAPKGFFTYYIVEPAQGLFGGIWSVITWPYNALFGGSAVEEDDEDEMAEPEEVKQAQEGAQESQEVEVTEEITVKEPEEAPQEEAEGQEEQAAEAPQEAVEQEVVEEQAETE